MSIPPHVLPSILAAGAGTPQFKVKDNRLYAVHGRDTKRVLVKRSPMFAVFGPNKNDVTVRQTRAMAILEPDDLLKMRGYTGLTEDSGTSIEVPLPADAVVGSLMIMHVVHSDVAAPTATGWTEEQTTTNFENGANDTFLTVYSRVRDATDGLTVTLTQTLSDRAIAHICAVHGLYDPITVTVGQDVNGDHEAIDTGAAAITDGIIIVAFTMAYATNGTWDTLPAGFTSMSPVTGPTYNRLHVMFIDTTAFSEASLHAEFSQTRTGFGWAITEIEKQ